MMCVVALCLLKRFCVCKMFDEMVENLCTELTKLLLLGINSIHIETKILPLTQTGVFRVGDVVKAPLLSASSLSTSAR